MFKDRRDAGRHLAQALKAWQDNRDAIVLALPRGGVPVGDEIARFLHVPLDVLVVRKLGAPGQEELALGALGPDGSTVLNEELLWMLGISEETVAHIVREERRELERRLRMFRGNRPFPDLRGKTVILVDDGLATGATARVAIRVVRGMGAASVILAVPIGARQAVTALRGEVDTLICLESPADFQSVSTGYLDFRQTTDAEVVELLSRFRELGRMPAGENT
jgi:predicted phosphoribosyltransferase